VGDENGAPCPQGRTDYEECFAPFRYCPVKGCGRAEGDVRLPTDAEPEPERTFEHGVRIGRILHAVDQQGRVLTEDDINALISDAPGGHFAHVWLCDWLAADPEQRTAMTAALVTEEQP